MKSDLGFNKLRLFNKIFGIDIAKASAAYTVERDLIDSINIPTKIVKRAHHKDALLTFLSSDEPLKPEIIEIKRWKNILQFKFNLCLNHCYEIIQFDNGSSIDTKDGRLEINKDLYFIINRDSISLYNGSRQIRSDKIEISEEGIRINSSIRTESAIFGTGERALNLNLKGHKVNLWNRMPTVLIQRERIHFTLMSHFILITQRISFMVSYIITLQKVLLILEWIRFIMNFPKEVVTSFSFLETVWNH